MENVSGASILQRCYSSTDLLVLKALLEHEGCSDALIEGDLLCFLDMRKGRNLLYRQRGDMEWVHSLTVPLWREIVSMLGEENSEVALRYVAKLLVKKALLLEADLPKLTEGWRFEVSPDPSDSFLRTADNK